MNTKRAHDPKKKKKIDPSPAFHKITRASQCL